MTKHNERTNCADGAEKGKTNDAGYNIRAFRLAGLGFKIWGRLASSIVSVN